MSAAAESTQVVPNLFGEFMKRAKDLSDKGPQYKGVTSFIQFCEKQEVERIIDAFKYPDDTTSYVVLKDGSPVEINAGTFNDYYKCTMAPVIRTVYDDKKCVVQFRVDWRFGSSFNSHMEEYVKNGGIAFKTKLANKLNDFSTRRFTDDMINTETRRGLDTGPGSWKKFFKGDNVSNWEIFDGKALIASVTDINEIAETYSVNDGGAERDINIGTDFYEGTSILKFTPVPKVFDNFPIVVLSIVAADSADGKPDVRATGNWPRCSWLETPMMQACYEFLHTEYLNRTGISYGRWMAEALYRTFSGMCFLNDKPIKVALFSGRRTGGALFHLLQVWLWSNFDSSGTPAPTDRGKNLGTSSFWALQTLEKLLGNKPAINPTGTHAHELSMTLATLYPQLDDVTTGNVGTQLLGHILYSLISGGNGTVPLLSDTVGTANFLKTACALNLPEFLRVPGETNCFTRFSAARQDSGELEHYKLLMMAYSALSGRDTCPMLMASEIDDRDLDFIKAILLGIQLAGVGGALGDSEKIDALIVFAKKFKCRIDGHDDKEKKGELTRALDTIRASELNFAASMAVKIVCVFVAGSDRDKARYTLKTGDAEGKLTIDPEAPTKETLKRQGEDFQQLHRGALEACLRVAPPELTRQFEEINHYIHEFEKKLKAGDSAGAASLQAPPHSSLQKDYEMLKQNLDLKSLPKFDKAAISDKQKLFTELLRRFTPERSSGGVSSPAETQAAVSSSDAQGSAAAMPVQGVGKPATRKQILADLPNFPFGVDTGSQNQGGLGIPVGGRRTRRKGRKVTKKRVRKNIRKSKNKKSRRSYRRKSKK